MTDFAPAAALTGPPCAATNCPQLAVVQWQRRSADPEHTEVVHACPNHTITLALGSRIHAAQCSAPNPADLPGCDCSPEEQPTPEPNQPDTVTLATGWTIPTPA